MDDRFSLAKSIGDGTLDLICPQMELLVCPAYHESALAGSGVIRSNDKGQLYFKLTAPFTGKPHPALQRHRPPGEVYEEHDHVMLRAVDQYGREWRSNWLLLHLTMPTAQPSWFIRHNLERLICARATPLLKQSTMTLHIPAQDRLPFDQKTTETRCVGDRRISTGWSLDHHTCTLDDAEVTFRDRGDSWLSVTATRDSPIMPDWPGLICQALEFGTARRARPAVAIRAFNDGEHIGLFSGPFLQYQSQLPPPVHAEKPTDAEHFWALIERFFMFAMRDDPRIETFLDELTGIRNGASASVQTACLTLAIGVESLCKLLLPSPSPSVHAESLKELVAYLKEWEGDESIKTRAVHMVNQFPSVRAVDRLYAWASQHGVGHTLIDRWKELRHPKAHGTVVSEDQSLYDHYYAVVELLYRMVAWAIGYKGPIVETSKRGWGDVEDDQIAHNDTSSEGKD